MVGSQTFPFLQPKARRSVPRPGGRALRSIPRMAQAVVRVPDPLLQLEIVFPPGQPQIFVHEGARQLLERRLSAAAGEPVLLSITDNRRSMIRHFRKDGVLRVRIHHMFVDAPAAVQESLVRYVVQGDREASALVGKYINDNMHRIRADRRRRRKLRTRGTHHDLLAIFRELNDKYFDGQVDALITWARRPPKRSKPRKTIKLGSYSATERLIAVHRVLDRAWVPRYFVAFVVYHEMLHHLIPAVRTNGRAALHPAAFREREKMFRLHDRACAWERAHIARLLRA